MSLLWNVVLCFSLLWLKYAGATEVKDFVLTINDVQLRALPSNEEKRGARINLTCSVDILQNTPLEIENQYSFFKEDSLVYNTTSVEKTALYSIVAARVSHSGHYKCIVSSNGKDQSSKELTVTVSGLAPPNITISKEEAKEGDTVEVSCEVPDEKPPFEFTFIKTNQHHVQQSIVRKALSRNYFSTKFQVAEGDGIFLYFQCSATIQSVPISETSGLSERKIVGVTAPFTTPTLTVWPPGNITEGRNMTVECRVRAHKLPDDFQVTMQKDKKIVGSSKDGRIVLHIIATVDHMGNYTCKAESKKVSKSSSLNIHVAELFPRPRLFAAEMHISEDGTLSLSCHVMGQNQTLLTFVLEKDKTRRIPMKQHGKYSKKATEADSGLYVCGVTIQNITKWSKELQIFVYAPVTRPVLTQDTRQGFDVVVGQNFTLKCKSSAGTPPFQYRLYQGKQILGWANVTGNASAEFHLLASTSHHSGGYRCEAKNKNRASWKSSNMLNISAIAPVEEISLTIIPDTGDVVAGQELSLVCRVQNGSLPVTFTFFRRDQQDQNVKLNQMVEHKHNAYWITSDFEKSKEGFYFCTATNQANVSTTSIHVRVKVVLASWKKTIIASSVVAVCIAITAAVIWWYLHKKKKDKDLTLPLSRTTNSNNAKLSSIANTAEDPYYGHNENGENHTEKSAEEKEAREFTAYSSPPSNLHKKDLLLPGPNVTTNDVEYVEVMQETADPHKAPPPRGTDTVYSEIRRSQQDAEENNTMRIEGSPDAT